jgi:hypothetical protein
MSLTAKRKREMQSAGVKFGCWVNFDNGDQDAPDDDCSIDYDFRAECTFARHHRTREGCPYWREVVEIKESGK